MRCDIRANRDFEGDDVFAGHPFADYGPIPRFDGRPGVLLDRNGVEIAGSDMRLVAFDTETGDVLRYACVDGVYEIDAVSKRVRVWYERHPAPLRYVPRNADSVSAIT